MVRMSLYTPQSYSHLLASRSTDKLLIKPEHQSKQSFDDDEKLVDAHTSSQCRIDGMMNRVETAHNLPIDNHTRCNKRAQMKYSHSSEYLQFRLFALR
jgi:hypothetical protein